MLKDARWYQVRPSYILAAAIILAFTLWTCMPNFTGMLGKTGIKPALSDGTHYGTVVSHGRDNMVLVDIRGEGQVEFRPNNSTPDDILMTMSMVKDGMLVKIKVSDGGDLTEWLWIKNLPGE